MKRALRVRAAKHIAQREQQHSRGNQHPHGVLLLLVGEQNSERVIGVLLVVTKIVRRRSVELDYWSAVAPPAVHVDTGE
jgi:hypothetical protein